MRDGQLRRGRAVEDRRGKKDGRRSDREQRRDKGTDRSSNEMTGRRNRVGSRVSLVVERSGRSFRVVARDGNLSAAASRVLASRARGDRAGGQDSADRERSDRVEEGISQEESRVLKGRKVGGTFRKESRVLIDLNLIGRSLRNRALRSQAVD
jgi:hypothetical protein